jgi:hypothetical protein
LYSEKYAVLRHFLQWPRVDLVLRRRALSDMQKKTAPKGGGLHVTS